MSIRNVYKETTSFTSLLQAEHDVTAGKGEKRDVLLFEQNLEDNLHALSSDLRNGLVPKVRYNSFYVYVPKTRKVIYIDYPNKIIQRAVYNTINPRLNKGFISDTYACIPGRGQLAAMLRVKEWMENTRHNPGDWYVYKFDVAKFFYRIDHERLLALLHHKIADRQMTDLLEYYICNTGMAFGLPLTDNQQNPVEPDALYSCGIPIGGGLSHTLGNLYLDPLDQFAKRELRIRQYARYMDDIILIDNSKDRLKENGKRMEEFLNERLLLEFNRKTALRPARLGVEFVGCVIYDDHIRLRKSTTLRMKRRLSEVEREYNAGLLPLENALQTANSYRAMLKHVDMDRFEETLWANFVLTHGDLREAKAHPILYKEET